MNYNKNNNDNNPWGSGNNNNPWGSGGGNGSNKMDFEDSIKKAKDSFGRFKFGGRRNLSLFIIIAILSGPKPSYLIFSKFFPIFVDDLSIALLIFSFGILADLAA